MNKLKIRKDEFMNYSLGRNFFRSGLDLFERGNQSHMLLLETMQEKENMLLCCVA